MRSNIAPEARFAGPPAAETAGAAPSGPATAERHPALTYMHVYAILMHMRTTLIIDNELLKKAQELTGLEEKTAVLHAGLRALITRESAKRLAALGGSERTLKTVPRRRPRSAK